MLNDLNRSLLDFFFCVKQFLSTHIDNTDDSIFYYTTKLTI